MVKCTFDKSIISVRFAEELILRRLAEWFKATVLSTVKVIFLQEFESLTFCIRIKIRCYNQNTEWSQIGAVLCLGHRDTKFETLHSDKFNLC